MSGDTSLYDVWVSGTADWFAAKIEGGKFVKPDEGTLSVRTKSCGNAGSLQLSAHEVSINRHGGCTGEVLVHLFVEVPPGKEKLGDRITVRLTHGDCGMVRMSSPFHSVLNDQIIDHGQNAQLFTLALDRAAKKALEDAYEANAKSGHVTQPKDVPVPEIGENL